MKDILITSSVLILALLVLRQAFRRTVSRRVQYALWGLVLLRLLVPVSLPAVEHNVLTTAEPVGATVSEQMERVSVYLSPVAQGEPENGMIQTPDNSTPAVVVRDNRSGLVDESGRTVQGQSADAAIMSADGTSITYYAKSLTLSELLTYVWYAGIAVMACWLAVSNLRFWRKLCKARIPYRVENCRYPVYLVESGLPSPCLFGLFRPAIYLTPAAAASPESLRHVLAHETTHARHLDPLWSLLRGVCLAVYWFDPLVWIAAVVSRTDCELACDEGALKRLDQAERIAYGRTLLALIPVAARPSNPVLTATTMTSGKRQLKDRITRIAENRQTRMAALFAVIALAAVICAATFTAAKSAASHPLTPEELARFNIDFFGEAEAAPFRRQFLTSLYAQPEDIDMFQLFCGGTGYSGGIGAEERQLLADTYYDGLAPELDLIKLPAREIDQRLVQYTGLTLAETQALNMGEFHYLADYDAYYHFHGDTNAAFHFSFAAGEREGNLVRLYYRADGLYAGGDFGQYSDGWCCLTLEEIPAGSVDGFPYYVVSNQLCERPEHLLGDVTALTGAELAYFNETFFNNDTVDNMVGLNIRNQFLTSLYARPEDIDLYELFYCGTGMNEALGDAELALVGSFDLDGEQICPTDKLSVSAINSVLLANTGLTLEQANRTGLENFEYLAEYDAYYHTHGDTNYFSGVSITAGTREGDTIRLYYPDTSARYDCGWLCVTLEAQADGSYWFVSNLPSEKPVIPTVYPAGDPVLTIPLTDLTPIDPQPAEVTSASDDCAVRGSGMSFGDGISVRPYLSTDGNLYAALIYSEAAGRDGMAEWEVGRFFTFPEGNSIEYGSATVSVGSFRDLFGYSGAIISYNGQHSQQLYGRIEDYYYFTDDGAPVLLARTYGGGAQLLDLDGDGEFELAADAGGLAQLFFQRDGGLYCADIKALLEDAWPDAQYLSFGNWDINSRCLHFSGEVPIPDSNMSGTASRYLYFSGDELLVYRDGSTYTDHINDSIDAPADVLAAAREYVMSQYVQGVRCYDLVDGDFVQVREDYDDWRITKLSGPCYEDAGGLRIEIWKLSYECHTSTQHWVSLAGGSYITEDRWCMIGYPGCDYLYFQVDKNGTRTYLYHAMENVCSPGTELFRTDMVWTLIEMELLSMTDLDSQTLLDMLCVQPTAFLNRLAEDQTEAVQSAVIGTLGAYLASESSYAVQNAYASCVNHAAALNADFTDAGRALWEQLQDRIAEGAQEAAISAPPAVLAAAQEKAAAEFASFRTLATDGAQYDDWRISHLSLAAVCDDYSVTAAVYQMGCAYHPVRPEAVSLAGSMELTGDGWVGGFHSDYLVFSLDGGRYTLLDGGIPFDTDPDAPAFQAELAAILLKNGLVELSELDADTLLHMFYVGYPPYFLNLVGTYSAAERTAVIKALDAFHNRGDEYDRSLFRDAMQTAAWGIRDLDANGRTFWGELLNYTGITPSGIGGSYSDLTTAVHQAILYDLESTSAQTCDFHAESHRVLDTVRSGNTCTVYLLMQTGCYGLTDGGYQLVTGGTEAAALTFATINGQYQLIEFWTPPGGADDASGIRTCFPAEAAATAVNPDASLLEALQNQLEAAAAEAFSQVRGFTKADVEFTGQALTADADTMSYEERLDWCERGGSIEQGGIGFHVETFWSQDGYIAYAGNMAGVSPGASAWNYLYLRFPDGTLAGLPLPKNARYSTPLPDTLSFADGKLVYGVSFPDELADGGTLVHLAGTYHYETDLSAKTVSLTVLDN